MPRKKAATAAALELPSTPKELFDQFVKGKMSAKAVQSASMAFKKALIERALGAELGHHLGYPATIDTPVPTKFQTPVTLSFVAAFPLRPAPPEP
jgi:putative transposase